MKGEARSRVGRQIQAAAEEAAWTRAVIRAAVLIVLAFAAAWWWGDLPWPGAGGMIPAADAATEHLQRQAAYLGWAAMAMLLPAFYAFWARNRSGRAARTWRSHWTLGCWIVVLHLAVSMAAASGGSLSGIVTGSRPAGVVPPLVVALWWLGDIALAARENDEGRLAMVQRVALGLAILALFATWTFRAGEPLAGKILSAALIAATVVAAQDAWTKRGRG